MFGIGSTELLVILVIALIVLGPKSLATVSRSLGKAMGQFRRASTEFQRAINLEVAQEETKSIKKEQEKPVHRDSSAVPDNSPLAEAIVKTRAEASKLDAKCSGEPSNER